ncbi:MAG: VWA domain-containing protein [Clostridia bacterium]|nr:VWA domain-containing protein [Clostridia bacterium]
MKRMISLFLAILLSAAIFPACSRRRAGRREEAGSLPTGEETVGTETVGTEAEERPEEPDTDTDGLSDAYERLFGANPAKSDTDGDGLNDGVELRVGTDPALPDTDGNGVPDGDEDADGDGLTNLDEIDRGTDPADDDTDDDGLGDAKEFDPHGTDALKWDTDGDGSSDGWEISNGYDPLHRDESFHVVGTAADAQVSAAVSLELPGDRISTLKAAPAAKDDLLSEDIPGYMGGFSFEADGEFESAELSFTFDSSFEGRGEVIPTIYWLNETTQMPEELPTVVSGNTASTSVTHFSTYILLNKVDFEKVWEKEIKPPMMTEESGEETILQIAFVIDYSASMDDNDPDQKFKVLTKNFISRLRDGEDEASVTEFIRAATLLSGLTTDKQVLTEAVESIVYDDGYGWYSGTNGSEGINMALEVLTERNETESSGVNTVKFIIFMTDGQDTHQSYSYDSLAEKAVEAGIRIYTIGLGSAEEAVLRAIADATGGRYYHATAYSSSEDILDLDSVYEEIESETVDLVKDENNDGIPDYYMQLMCRGDMRLGTGAPSPFFGIPFEDVQANADYDHDGLINGKELIVRTENERVYTYYESNPVRADSDYDGIDDNEELPGYVHSNHFEGRLNHSSGGTSYDADVEFVVDYSYFFEDNTEFNQDLATLASIYACDMYDSGSLTLSRGATGDSASENGVSLGEIFGMKDGVNIDANELRTTYAEGTGIDPYDVSEVYFGHRPVACEGEEREIFILAVRGTNGTVAEWSSNFDIGADDASYYDKTGKHPDWSNKENHKGFDVAAVRVLKAFHEYVRELEAAGIVDPNGKRSIFITGHSRGGGVANILGAYFEDSPEYDSYVYTMASPFTTTSGSWNSYRTIFNIRNADDLVTYLPLMEWGFHKYGRTLEISVADHYEDTSPFGNAADTFEAVFHKDYDKNQQLKDTQKAFGKMSGGRSDFYVIDEQSGDGKVLEGGLHRKEKCDEFVTMLKDLKLWEFCECSIEGYGLYTITVKYCPAYAARLSALLAATDDIKNHWQEFGYAGGYDTADLLGIDLKGKYSSARTSFVLGSGQIPGIGSMTGGMACPHIPGSYYLISHNTEYSDYTLNPGE